MVSTDIIRSTIMFTDIVGYSVMANKDQEHALELLSTHDSIIEPIISQYEGKVIKKKGGPRRLLAPWPRPIKKIMEGSGR